MNLITCGLVLNYRDPKRTSQCIKSLLAEGIHHILVWDNSADDGHSAKILAKRWRHDSRITLYESPTNLGFAAGVNRGIEWLQTHHPSARILLINNDARLLPGAVRLLNSALDQHPQAAIAYPAIDHNGIVRGTAYYQKHLGLLTFHKPLPYSFSYPSGCALLIAPQRGTLPLFDEDFFMYGEDWLLGWRLGPERKIFVPDVLVQHEGTASSGVGSKFYETHIVAGHWILADKLARNPTERLLFIAGRWLSLTARATVRAVRHRSLIPFQALIEGQRLAKQAITHPSR